MGKVTENETEEQKARLKKEKRIAIVKELIWYLAFVFICLFVVPHFVAEGVEVDGESMEDTLHDEDRLIAEKFTLQFGELKRFDVVVFYPPEEFRDPSSKYWIKRVIGLPGETVQIKGETIYINGEPLEENYGKEPIEDAGLFTKPYTLGEDEYFLMGDNRNNSTDSRVIGPVKKSVIAGRACFCLWPLNEIGTIDR